MSKVAILVDGGFYRRRAQILFGDMPAEQRCSELIDYIIAGGIFVLIRTKKESYTEFFIMTALQ